jgi:hypothetical protein
LIAKCWDEFLVQNNDSNIKSLADIKDSGMLFPKPPNYLPDTFLEVRNWIDYPGLPSLMQTIKEKSIHEIDGMSQALQALEAQRKRDLEDWMDNNNLDVVAFPAQGDVGLADLEFEYESTKHSLTNGVKYSNGNRAIRHLGVPTVSVPMGIMEEKKMPVNITFAGKGYTDQELLGYAYAFEQATKKRAQPPLGELTTDLIHAHPRPVDPSTKELGLSAEVSVSRNTSGDKYTLLLQGAIDNKDHDIKMEVYIDGKHTARFDPGEAKWNVDAEYTPQRPECLGWDLKPLPPRKAMVVVIARSEERGCDAKLLWVDWMGGCR